MAFLNNVPQIDCANVTCVSALGAAGTQVQDCPANITQAEVNSIIAQHPTLGTAITNWPATGQTGLVAGDIVIDNTDATSVALKQFFGVGSIAAPEESLITLNDGQETVLSRKYSLVFTMWDINSATYDWLRKVQCGSIKPKLYYTDRANYGYGVDGGLTTTKWAVSFPKDTGDDAVNRAEITITWNAKNDPDRVVWPL